MAKNIKPYYEHLKNADDLVTTYESVRAGFVALALEKNRAAIEKKMAYEIWQQLKDDTLDNAANLTDTNQIASLSRWLCNL